MSASVRALAEAVPREPVTPKKKSNAEEQVDHAFNDFEHVWNLGLSLPDKQSPSKSNRADFNYRVHKRFFYLFISGQLEDVLDEFRKQAIDMAKKWIKKPRGDPDVLPSITGLPKARNEEERRGLRSLLDQLLNGFGPQKNASSEKARSFQVTETIETNQDAAAFTHPISSFPDNIARSKRPSNEWAVSPAFKRPKSITSERSNSNSSHGGSRRPLSRLGQNLTGPSERTHPNLPEDPGSYSFAQSFYQQSDHTSKETFITASDDVFSQTDMPPPASQETQITVEYTSQEKRRLPPPPASRDSGSSYSVSSSLKQALEESVKKFEDSGNFRADSPAPVFSSSFSDISLQTEEELANLDPQPSVQPPPISPSKQDAALVSPSKRSLALEQLEKRLNSVWPTFPPGLEEAPLPIRWELLRVCLHAGVDIQSVQLQYQASWRQQDSFWDALKQDHRLNAKPLPERSSPRAWDVSFENFQDNKGNHVVFAASLDFNAKSDGPLFHLGLRPLRLDQPYRLSRRFGADRFLEIIIPSITLNSVPDAAKNLGDAGIDCINDWLAQGPHYLLGRHWKRFFTRPYKESAKKSPRTESGFEPEPKVVMKHRVYFFAENGDDFQPPIPGSQPPMPKTVDPHTSLSINDMIGWLLQISKNEDQPCLKLFSRIQLGLSRTRPTVTLQPGQIRHRDSDLLSPATDERGRKVKKRKVMNDGCGRMSLSLARKIRAIMGLEDIPSGYQGRIGCAKGFWIVDVEDDGKEDWIETYPSQRKWKCDFVDEHHRVFEAKSSSRPLKSADLNYQFLPILQERATDPVAMKTYIGEIMANSIRQEIEEQRKAIEDPVLFRKYIQEKGSSTRQERLALDCVPFAGGFPRFVEDQMTFLIDGGFHPKKQKFLWDLSWKFRRDKCVELRDRMHIRVGRSAYVYMVVDFLGVLEENEIHLGFSSSFRDEQSGFSETFLHGMDVLVARSPAHFISDIQKVKAVFKLELGSLKDVIIFPRKGAVSLADKLSGGDYDGDMAWVCWDSGIVDLFNNAKVPDMPDLSQHLTKETTTLQQLVEDQGRTKAMEEFFKRSCEFNMQPSMLGMCTNFKDKYCYQSGSVRDEPAVLLSSLLSNLVDQAKQGIRFGMKDWTKFRKDLLPRGMREPPDPPYKSNVWDGKGDPTHITDYLKFSVLRPIIDNELANFSKSNSGNNGPYDFDEDLTQLARHYQDMATQQPRIKSILSTLANEFGSLHRQWQGLKDSKDNPFEVKIAQLHDKYRSISPKTPTRTVERILLGPATSSGGKLMGFTQWDLLKASLMFKLYYNKGTNFVWRMAGRELQRLKADARESTKPGDGGPQVVVSPIYAALRPDSKYTSARAARMGGQDVDVLGEDEELPPEDDV